MCKKKKHEITQKECFLYFLIAYEVITTNSGETVNSAANSRKNK